MPVFSHLSGCFFISHRSFSSLNFLFELKNHLRNPAKSGQRKSLNNFKRIAFLSKYSYMLSKKLTTTLMALSLTAISAFADGNPAQITTVPSPAVSNKALEVKITTSDLGQEVYLYTWCKDVNGEEVSPWKWDDVNTSQFKMSGSGGTYTFRIDDIKSFYSLSDAQLDGLTKLGFIAKTRNGGQTADCFVNVEQAPRESYGGGYGTQDSPYILKTAEHLQAFSSTSSHWNGDVYVVLGADIDAAGLSSPIGSLSSPYKGHFDGAGYAIKNLSLNNTSLGTSTALFGAIDGAEIKCLGVVDANVKGMNDVATIVGTLISGKIERCFASGIVGGQSICVGGLVGENLSGIIADCYSCVSVENAEDYATGGVAGKNHGIIRNVYATGAITGKDYVGGIVGANYGTISNSVALNTKVVGTHDFTARFGGNGNAQNAGASNHSWDAMEKNSLEWGSNGHHGDLQSAYDLVRFNTFQTMTGWDFNNIWEWKVEDGKPYPALRKVANQTNMVPENLFAVSVVEEIVEANGVSINVGPNPFSDYLNVICTEGIAAINVYSVSGTKAASINNPAASEVSVDMSGAPAGFYVVNVVSESGSKSTFKLIKK